MLKLKDIIYTQKDQVVLVKLCIQKNIWQRFTVKPELLTEDLEEEKEVITSDGAEVFGDELEYDNWDDAVFENGGEG